jgi:CO dehydrogenase/acetyl-CoA synthase delta subunit
MSDTCGTSCCGKQSANSGVTIQPMLDADWISGYTATNAGLVPTITTNLTRSDRMGAAKVRWGIGRMNYIIPPGIYAVGQPETSSPVLVTANYKLTFDRLRSQLKDLNAWILVLDTKGINVWCAAGKGTFGTGELINRIRLTRLDQIVSHNKLILPQLSAPGVAAHLVKEATGFNIKYGPVYAHDLPEYFRNDSRIKPEMRRICFPLSDRLALIPMEFVPALKYIPVILIWLVIIQFLRDRHLSFSIVNEFVPYFVAILSGTVLFQILLPWLPFRSFIINGWLLAAALLATLGVWTTANVQALLPLMLILPPVAAYLAVNFTGSTTFTSLSGVKKELAWGIPLIIVSIITGLVIQIVMIV